jgi:quercetin dioxygenase-like cupin family protein
MEKVRIEDVESRTGPADVKRPLTRALGATNLSVNYYELAPGESFAFGYHAHSDQEEVFYVVSGTVTFETEDGPVAVGPEEVVRFGPGEFQRGVNEVSEPRSDGPEDERSESSGGAERVVALALGAPKESGDLDLRRECSDCGGKTPNRIERPAGGEGLVTVCEDCDAETGRFD